MQTFLEPRDRNRPLHVARCDLGNMVANVPAEPPANSRHGLRDNKAGSGLSVETPTLEFAASENGKKTSYHQISGSRFGDNFVVAVHPNRGPQDPEGPETTIAESYKFELPDPGSGSGTGSGSGAGSGSGSGSGSGGGGGAVQQRVLKYRRHVEVGSGSGSGQPQYEERWDELPKEYRTSILTIYPSVDIDTDSNNSGTLERSIAEELVEAQSPGKRLFINHDDDNRNGIPDKDEMNGEVPAVYTHPDNDLVPVILDFGLSTFEGMGGYRLALLSPNANNLRIWATPTREPVTNLGGQPDPDGARAFIWTIDENNPPATPMTVYVEGIAVQLDNEGDPTASSIWWEPLSPVAGGGVPVSYSDSIRVTVEPVVWPSNETGTDWKSKPTTQWNGFTLPAGWWIEYSLEGLITSPGNIGEIRTLYPEIGGSEPKALNEGIAGGEGPDIYSVGPDGRVDYNATDGFELVLEFRFDRENNEGNVIDSGYVRINKDYDRTQLDLFGNSGVKIAEFYEIGIFDTNALLQEANNLNVTEDAQSPALGQVTAEKVAADGVTKEGFFSNVPSATPDKRYITQLMTGVPYDEKLVSNAVLDADPDVGNNNGELDDEELALTPFKSRPTNFSDTFYEDMLKHNAGLVSETGWNTLRIRVQVERDSNGAVTGYTVKSWLNSEEAIYSTSGVTHGTGQTPQSLIGKQLTVRLQNHWDSGVAFRKAKITPLGSQ
jgi:hypothetical protein